MKAGIWIIGVLMLSCTPAFAQGDGAALYATHCARCHDLGSLDVRAPQRSVLLAMTAEQILAALDKGTMATVVLGISQAKRVAIAEFVAGKKLGQAPRLITPQDGGRCRNAAPRCDRSGTHWNGWGASVTNSRFQSAEAAAISPETVSNLKLKWAFGFEGSLSAIAQPTVVGGRVFVGGGDRKVHALDATTGCVHWEFATGCERP
jgi:polyvinyl alcohol dehydrogenase (cytochrome)